METEPKNNEVTENGEVVEKTAVELVTEYIPEYVRLVESREEWKGRNYIGNLGVHENEDAEAGGYRPRYREDCEPSVRHAQNLFVYHFERETNDKHFLINSLQPHIRKKVKRAIKQGTNPILVNVDANCFCLRGRLDTSSYKNTKPAGW